MNLRESPSYYLVTVLLLPLAAVLNLLRLYGSWQHNRKAR